MSRLVVEACVATHIGDRAEQQDRVALYTHPTRPGIMLAILADGMGGHSGGAMAAEQVLIKAEQNLAEFSPQYESPESLLDSVINEAHIVIKLTRFTSEQDPHSTAVAFLLQPGQINWAHCGDSRLYRFRDGIPLLRSPDHSLVGELLRKGRITEAGSLVHPQRNVLLSCLGGERDPWIEYGKLSSPVAGDHFLLCSDGLWSYFPDEELGEIINTYSAREAARILVDLARKRAAGYGDNISLVIIKMAPPSAE